MTENQKEPQNPRFLRWQDWGFSIKNCTTGVKKEGESVRPLNE